MPTPGQPLCTSSLQPTGSLQPPQSTRSVAVFVQEAKQSLFCSNKEEALKQRARRESRDCLVPLQARVQCGKQKSHRRVLRSSDMLTIMRPHKKAIVCGNVYSKCTFHYFDFVLCYGPAAGSQRRCISDLCFSWLPAGSLACCVDLLAIPPVLEIDCVRALQKQSGLCALDNVAAQFYMPKPHIWD